MNDKALPPGPHALYAAVGLILAGWFSGAEFDIGPFVVRPSDLGLTLLAGSILASQLLSGLLVRPRLTGAETSLLLFLLFRAVNALWLADNTTFIAETVQALEAAVLLWLVGVAYHRSAASNWRLRAVRSTFSWFVRGLIVIGAVAILFHYGSGQTQSLKVLDEPRLVFGFLAVFAAARVMSPWHATSSGIRTYVYLFAALIVVVLSGERKAWVSLAAALAAGLAVTTFKWGRTSSRSVAVTVTLIAAVSVAVPVVSAVSGEYFARQVVSFKDAGALVLALRGDARIEGLTPSNNERLLVTQIGMSEYRESPWFGIGADGLSRLPASTSERGELIRKDVHNEYLKALIDTGLFGLVIYLMVPITLFARLWRMHRRLDSDGVVLAVMLSAYASVLNAFEAGGFVNVILWVPAFLAVRAAMYGPAIGRPISLGRNVPADLMRST